MKKVLFATTALVATAGVAAADIAITGTAEFGIVGGDRYGLYNDETGIESGLSSARLHNSYTLNFAMSGATDNGLSFGATTRFDMDAGNEENQGIAHDNGTAFISGSFGRITLGDTDGALDWALTEVGIGGAIADDNTAHAGYSGNGGLDGSHDDQVLRYEYTMGDVGIAISYEQANNGQSTRVVTAATPVVEADNGSDTMAVGIRYAAAGLSFGVGFQRGDLYIDADAGANFSTAADARTQDEMFGATAVGISAGYVMNNIDLRASMMRWDIDATANDGSTAGIVDEVAHIGLGIGYTMDALTLAANWGRYDFDNAGISLGSDSGFGLAANYDLGGGVVAQLGYGVSNREGTDADTESYSLGLAMSF